MKVEHRRDSTSHMISVVLATYQGERYIDAQLDSIIQQLDSHDEIIVSDDASSDGTVGAIQRRADPRIRLFAHNDRVGYVENFQRAIDEIRGQYVFFADQDDVWLPGKVTTMLDALQGKGFAVSDAKVVNHHLELLFDSYFSWRGARRFTWETIFLKPPIIGATMSCRMDYLQTLLPLPTNVPHDFWLTFNAAWDDQLKVLEVPLILYRRHGSAHSPTATTRTRSIGTILRERIAVISNMIGRRRS